MNTNDRFALELGRALVRALVAEASLEVQNIKVAEFENAIEKGDLVRPKRKAKATNDLPDTASSVAS